jgi:hypothetical protein
MRRRQPDPLNCEENRITQESSGPNPGNRASIDRKSRDGVTRRRRACRQSVAYCRADNDNDTATAFSSASIFGRPRPFPGFGSSGIIS